VDPAAIYDYLFFHMVPAPKTAFRGVTKLAAGTMAVWRDQRLTVTRYWQPAFVEEGAGKFESLKAELFEALAAGVRATQPDGRSGAFLSGGLDSSTVAGMLSDVGPKPARTFSIGFGYPDYDELSYARIANARFGCQGSEYIVHGSDIAESFGAIAKAYDEPFGNSSALPAYYCARMAKDAGVDHLLAGDGGDELFAGNSRYAEQDIYRWYFRLPRWIRDGLLEPALAIAPSRLVVGPVRRARNYVSQAKAGLPARLETWNFVHRLGCQAILHPDFLPSIEPSEPFAHMQRLWQEAPCASDLNRMLWYDWQLTLADNDLRKVQTMADMAGVRVSYPMLHPDVVDVSVRVPTGLKMPGRKLRHFYKQAMAGYLPEQIIHKKKHGFGLPFGLWLQDSPLLRDRIFGNLSSLRTRRVIRPEFLDQLLALHGADDARYYGVFIWVLAMLEQWLQEHRLSL
jgi:asparagine synthase (glutamine-hydrolysing)